MQQMYLRCYHATEKFSTGPSFLKFMFIFVICEIGKYLRRYEYNTCFVDYILFFNI
jgi:hypothetical protein